VKYTLNNHPIHTYTQPTRGVHFYIRHLKILTYVFTYFSITNTLHTRTYMKLLYQRGADKSLARPGMKQATATEDFDFHISYL